ADNEFNKLIGGTLRLIAGICARDHRQLIPQLLCRFRGRNDVPASFLDAARRKLSRPAMLTRHPSLTALGNEIARLEGHWSAIEDLCVLPNGRLASASRDYTIRLWDFNSALETACLRGHSDYVSAVCALPDGRLVSGSWDKTVAVWDLESE